MQPNNGLQGPIGHALADAECSARRVVYPTKSDSLIPVLAGGGPGVCGRGMGSSNNHPGAWGLIFIGRTRSRQLQPTANS